MHVVIFSANVHVNRITFISLCLQLVFVTLNIELVQGKIVWCLSRLQENWQWELEVLWVNSFSAFQGELLHFFRVIKNTLYVS